MIQTVYTGKNYSISDIDWVENSDVKRVTNGKVSQQEVFSYENSDKALDIFSDALSRSLDLLIPSRINSS
jgi:hypothetical protein